jgi:hypothetical protein
MGRPPCRLYPLAPLQALHCALPTSTLHEPPRARPTSDHWLSCPFPRARPAPRGRTRLPTSTPRGGRHGRAPPASRLTSLRAPAVGSAWEHFCLAPPPPPRGACPPPPPAAPLLPPARGAPRGPLCLHPAPPRLRPTAFAPQQSCPPPSSPRTTFLALPYYPLHPKQSRRAPPRRAHTVRAPRRAGPGAPCTRAFPGAPRGEAPLGRVPPRRRPGLPPGARGRPPAAPCCTATSAPPRPAARPMRPPPAHSSPRRRWPAPRSTPAAGARAARRPQQRPRRRRARHPRHASHAASRTYPAKPAACNVAQKRGAVGGSCGHSAAGKSGLGGG